MVFMMPPLSPCAPRQRAQAGHSLRHWRLVLLDGHNHRWHLLPVLIHVPSPLGHGRKPERSGRHMISAQTARSKVVGKCRGRQGLTGNVAFANFKAIRFRCSEADSEAPGTPGGPARLPAALFDLDLITLRYFTAPLPAADGILSVIRKRLLPAK
jgi:hypothetical protein